MSLLTHFLSLVTTLIKENLVHALILYLIFNTIATLLNIFCKITRERINFILYVDAQIVPRIMLN